MLKHTILPFILLIYYSVLYHNIFTFKQKKIPNQIIFLRANLLPYTSNTGPYIYNLSML